MKRGKPSTPKPAESVSLTEARALAITAQQLAGPRPKTVTQPMLRALAEQLGVIQIDSVNVLSRSHYLPAFSRLGAYDRAALDALAFDPPRALFEYWGHEASLLPVDLHPMFRFRMAEAANDAWGRMRRLAKNKKAFIADVLRVVGERGPIAAGEVELEEAKKKKQKGGWWSWSDTKTAVEFLFWSGQVTSARRRSFERLYDLPERVLPPEVLAAPTPTVADAHRTLLERSARAIAIGTEADLRDYYRLALFAPQQMGDFIATALREFDFTTVHAIGLDVGAPSLLFAALSRPELFRSLVVGAGAMTFPLVTEGVLKSMIEAPVLPPLDANEVVGGFVASIRGYAVPPFVREDYLASYAGDRLTRSAALVRAYPKDLATLAPRLASITLPVAIVVGRNDPYALAKDAEILRQRLPRGRLDVLESGHCFWEERAPELESIVTAWVQGGYQH